MTTVIEGLAIAAQYALFLLDLGDIADRTLVTERVQFLNYKKVYVKEEELQRQVQ